MSTRVKFIWGASRVVRARWHLGWFGRYEHVPGYRDSGLVISVRGTLAWALAASALGWVGVASALFFVWERQPHSWLTFSDALLFPLRRKEIAAKQGRALIAEGLERWDARRHSEAVFLLQRGLARHPEHLRARLLLAQYQLQMRRWPLALATLQGGVAPSYPGRGYLQTLFSVAAHGDDHDTTVRVCEQWRGRLTPAQEASDGRWLQVQLFDALIATGRAVEALAVAGRAQPDETAAEQQVVALLALDRAEEAADFLERARAESRVPAGAIARLEARVFGAAGRFDEMEAALAAYRTSDFRNPEAFVFVIAQQVTAGRKAAAARALEDFIVRFGSEHASLLLAARRLAEQGELRLVQRCAAAAAEHGAAAREFSALIVSAALRCGEWSAAAQALAHGPPPATTDAPVEAHHRLWLERLVDAAMNSAESSQRALLEALGTFPWGIQTLRATVEVLQRANRPKTATAAAALALGMFPASAWAQAQAKDRTPAAGTEPP